MTDETNAKDTLFIRIDGERAVTADLYEYLLRPFWAEEYQKDPGAPGIPARLKQFMATRQRAIDRLEVELGIICPEDVITSFDDFLTIYEQGGLPIRAPYGVGDLAVVTDML